MTFPKGYEPPKKPKPKPKFSRGAKIVIAIIVALIFIIPGTLFFYFMHQSYLQDQRALDAGCTL